MSLFQFGVGLLLAATCSTFPVQDSTVSLPSNPAQWINSPPISAAAMKGKGVVLYFFEEG